MSICDTPFISALLTPLNYDERKDGQLVGWLVGGPVDDAQETVMGRVAPLSDSQNCSLSVAWLGPLNPRC